MSAPNPPTQQAKICVVCGCDCSKIDRVKNAEGRYVCKPCHERKTGRPIPDTKAAPDAAIASLYDRGEEKTCPQCDKPMPADAEICVACGYSLRSGRAVRTKLGKLDPGAAARAAEGAKRRNKPWLWVMGALAGGLLGAGGWAALAYFGATEAGYAAIVVGLLAGAGVAVSAREHCGGRTIGIALGLALLFIVIGKGGAGVVMTLAHGPKTPPPVSVTPDSARVLLAKEVAGSMAKDGKQLYWPVGFSESTATQQEHFPPEVWQEAMSKWEKSGTDWQEKYVKFQQESLQSEADQKLKDDRTKAFLATLDWMDLLWGGVGLVLAGVLGAGVHQMVRR